MSLCWQSLGSLVPDASSCLVFSACRVASLPTPGPWRVSPTSFPPSYKKTLIPSSLPSSYCQLLPPARPHSPTPTPAQPPGRHLPGAASVPFLSPASGVWYPLSPSSLICKGVTVAPSRGVPKESNRATQIQPLQLCLTAYWRCCQVAF